MPGTALHADVATRDLHSRSQLWTNPDRLPHGHVHRGSSPDLDEYVQFSVVSAKGIAFTTVRYDRLAYEDHGAQEASIRWSVDGFAADLDTQPIDPTDRAADVVFDLSAVPVQLAPDIDFRVYFFAASGDDWADLDASSGLIVEGEVYALGFLDADGDGFGNPSVVGAGPGHVTDATDCDDLDADRFPGNPEVCDQVDNDCDGAVDDDPADGTWGWADADLDGFGDPRTPLVTCAFEAGWSDNDEDCDDRDPAVSPDGIEIPENGVDEDCDGYDGDLRTGPETGETGDTGASATRTDPSNRAMIETTATGCGCQSASATGGWWRMVRRR